MIRPASRSWPPSAILAHDLPLRTVASGLLIGAHSSRHAFSIPDARSGSSNCYPPDNGCDLLSFFVMTGVSNQSLLISLPVNFDEEDKIRYAGIWFRDFHDRVIVS
jgi:hypothetical protein